MPLNHKFQSPTTWILRAIGWSVALLIIFAIMYKVMFGKQVERTVNCLEQTASGERASSPLTSVDKYAACIAGKTVAASALPPARCRYAGVWSSARGGMVYQVTLDVDGKFVAEPIQNAPANAEDISGAWNVAGRSLVWAYDSGAVWPPDINPIAAESDGAFTLAELDGATTRYTLIRRQASIACKK